MFNITKVYNKDTGVFDIHLVGNNHERYDGQWDKFFKHYSIKNIIVEGLGNLPPLKPKNERICRFCPTHNPNATFKNEAHLIPELLGNKTLFSDFECDDCNSRFSLFENDLTNYLGFTRSFGSGKGKKGVPKFKSPDKTLTFRPKNEEISGFKSSLAIEFNDDFEDHFTLDEVNKKVSIRAIKHSYNPYNVYKAILKLALSSIDEKEIKAYGQALKILNGETFDEKASQLYSIHSYFCPGPPFPSPLLILYERKNSNSSPCPKHMIGFLFNNYIYQIAIPFHIEDNSIYNGSTKIEYYIAPPLITKEFNKEYGFPQQFELKIDKDALVRNEVQDLQFHFDKFSELQHSDNQNTNDILL